MRAFRRAYTASTAILGIFAVLSLASSPGREGGVVMAGIFALCFGLSLVPFVSPGGFGAHLRWAVRFSIGFAGFTGICYAASLIDFMQTLGEGPHGEGAPGCALMGIGIFAVTFFCPWLLTARRGLAAAREAGGETPGIPGN